MERQIPVTCPSMPPLEEYIDEIRDIWESKWLTNSGGKHKRLETAIVDFMGASNIALFTNGHMALEAAVSVLGLKGEVITTPFTFASTTHAIVRNGLRPVFCDINPEDFTINAGAIEALVTENTSAILPVHVYGNLCDVEAIDRIAKKNGLKVIYDAAHAFGVTRNGEGSAVFGDISMFSFHATKVFHTIEGGALTFGAPELAEKLNSLKNFGIEGSGKVTAVGFNAKMSEFQAAMGLCNLRYANDEISKRKAVAERYDTHLRGIPGIRPMTVQKGVCSNYAYYPVVIDGFKNSRDVIHMKLKLEGITARKYFYPLTNDFECYQDISSKLQTPVAAHIADRVLALPMYAGLDTDTIDKICAIILDD